MKLLKSAAIAFSMYSKIPVPIVDWEEDGMKYALCFFPLVGVVIGLLEAIAGYVLHSRTDCGNTLIAAVMTMIPVLVTGGIHLDGFADTMDARSSYGDREKKLAILKDSNSGAFAVIGLCCYFLCTFALWTEIRIQDLAAVAMIFPFSRALSGISVVTFPPAKDSGLLRTFRDGAHRKRVRGILLFWAAAICICGICFAYTAGASETILGVPVLIVQIFAAVAAALLVFVYYYRVSQKEFGGTTGDLAGYFLQLCELAMLAAIVVSGGALWK